MKSRNRKTSRPGSGRTKGSFSFATLTLAQLNGKFSDPNMPIQVGRKWAENTGFTGLVLAPAKKLVAVAQPPVAQTVATVNATTTTTPVQS